MSHGMQHGWCILSRAMPMDGPFFVPCHFAFPLLAGHSFSPSLVGKPQNNDRLRSISELKPSRRTSLPDFGSLISFDDTSQTEALSHSTRHHIPTIALFSRLGNPSIPVFFPFFLLLPLLLMARSHDNRSNCRRRSSAFVAPRFSSIPLDAFASSYHQPIMVREVLSALLPEHQLPNNRQPIPHLPL